MHPITRRISGRLLSLGILCASLALLGTTASAQPYSFTTVDLVQTNTNLLPVSINNGNQVSAHINFFMTFGDIWRFDPVLGGVELYDAQVSFDGTDGPPINGSGEIGFYHRDGAGSDVVYGDGGALTVIAKQADIPNFVQFTNDYVDLNDAGQLVFTVRTNPGGVFTDVMYIGDGTNLDVIRSAAISSGEIIDPQPSINNLGKVSYMKQTTTTFEIVVYDSTTMTSTVLLDATGPFANFNRGTDINDNGDVTFKGTLDTNVSGIFTVHPGGGVTTHATTSDGFRFFAVSSGGHAALANNDAGEVVFLADLSWANPGTQRGLFKGSNPVDDAVLLEGDTLDGIEVLDIDLHHGGLNDFGEVAFITRQRDNGTGLYWRGIYRTDISPPVEVPALRWLGVLVLALGLASAGAIIRASRRLAAS